MNTLPAPATRRRVLALGAGAALLGWAGWSSAAEAARSVRASRALMGTQVDIAARDGDATSLRAATGAAFDRMAALAAAMSHYSPTSRVAAIKYAAGVQPVPVPRELMDVLQAARALSLRSGGVFDVTVGSLGVWDFGTAQPHGPSDAFVRAHLPMVGWRHLQLDARAGTAFLDRRGMALDLGGIAKLYILQAGLDTLRAHGVRTALVNGGGDVVAMSAAGAAPWRVGIRDPRAPQRMLAALDVRQGFVASSGDYERFVVQGGRRHHHVLDPRTGQSTEGVHGVTLVSPELEPVNGLGTAAMVLGQRAGRDFVERTAGVQGLIAGADGALWISPELRQRLG